MKALVTGGGGFIGSALVAELLKYGFNVTSYSRNEYPELSKTGVKVIRGNLLDYDSLAKASKGMDIVFHVAAKAGISGSYLDYYKTNVIGTENVIAACKLNGIRFLIYTSSASVIFNGKDIQGADETLPYPIKPLSYYTSTKALAEQLVLKADSCDLKTLALRPHLVYGPGDNHLIPRILSRAAKGKLRKIGDGNNIIDVTYIDNLVAAHLLAVEALKKSNEASGKPYFITNGEPVRLWDFLDKILEKYGYMPVRKSVSKNTALSIAAIAETFYRIFLKSKEPMITKFLVHELSSSHWFDISNARRYLNYNPHISNTEGLTRMTGLYPPLSTDQANRL